MKKSHFLVLKSVKLILIIGIISTPYVDAYASDNSQSRDEKTSYEIGDIYRFKYEKLRLNGSSKDVEIHISSIISNTLIVIKEGDIVEVEITNVTSEYEFENVQFWISIEGSNQGKIKATTSLALFFFIPNTDDSYYQDLIDNSN